MMPTLVELAHSTLAFAAGHSFRMTVVVAMVGGVLLAIRGASARTRLAVWTTALAVLLALFVTARLLPRVDVPLPAWTWSSATSIGLSAVTGADRAGAAGTTMPAVRSTGILWLAAAALYVLVAGVLVFRWCAGWWLTRRVIRHASPISDPALRALTRAHAASAGLAGSPLLVESDRVFVPFVCGVSTPAIVMPAAWRTWPRPTLDAVLVHELSHIARGDTAAMHLAAVYRAMTWVNPLSWWLRRHLERLAEAASDDAVLAQGIDAKQYAETLLSFFETAGLAARRAEWNLAMARRGAGAEAEARITRVLAWKGGHRMALTMKTRLLIAAGVVLVAAPVMLVNATRLEPADLEPLLPKMVTARAVPMTSPPLADQKVAPETPKTPPADVASEAPKTLGPTLKAAPWVRKAQPDASTSGDKKRVYAADTQGLVPPVPKRRLAPRYTAAALREKIEGVVVLEAVVDSDGTVSEVEVTKSLDTEYGLDDSAINTVFDWLFKPATLEGEAVPVRVEIQMEFRVR